MASTSFMAENQSFSEANSSWASLVIDQVQNSYEEDDYSGILDFDSGPRQRSASVETHGRPKTVDMKTFEQILQVMVQQGTTVDNYRRELEQLRLEYRQEIGGRDARLRLAEKEIHVLRIDRDKAVASAEALYAQYSALKSSGRQQAGPEMLSIEEHSRIVLRIKEDARTRIENMEAEKSHLTLQMTRLQIQVAQLRTQVDNRSYPEEILEELTMTLRHAVIEACQNGDVEAKKTKQDLAAAEARLLALEQRIESATSARADAEERSAHFEKDLSLVEKEYGELHAAYEEVQERLGILESTQGQLDETAIKEVQEQAEQLRAKLTEIEHAHGVALMNCEQLRSLLSSAEERSSTLTIEAQHAMDTRAQLEEQVLKLQIERDSALSEREEARAVIKSLEDKPAAPSTGNEDVQQALKDSEEKRERAERISKEAQNELRLANDRCDELKRVLEQESSKLFGLRQSESVLTSVLAEAHAELEKLRSSVGEEHSAKDKIISEVNSQIEALKMSHTKELSIKDIAISKATSDITELQANLEEATRKIAEVDIKLGEASRRLVEQRDTMSAEVHKAQATLKETEEQRVKAENQLNEFKESLLTSEKNQSDFEEQVKIAQNNLDSANNLRKELESELQQIRQSKETELREARQPLQEQIDRLEASLKDASSKLANETQLLKEANQTAEKIKKEHVKEVKQLEKDLNAAKKQINDLEASISKDQSEFKSQQEHLNKLEDSLKDAKKKCTEALRENERLRLLHAEAEGNRAEADILNEELEQKISAMEEEMKHIPELESELHNARAQLAEAIETMNVARGQANKYLQEASQCKTEIAELHDKNEQLNAARLQMARIYGLNADPILPPRSTPGRLSTSTPAPRNSLSLSPSTSSASPQAALDPTGPPTKRRKVSKWPLANGSSAARSLGSTFEGTNADTAISLEDSDVHSIASPSTPTARRHNGFSEFVPKQVSTIYLSFATAASWLDAEEQHVCGFCILHNHATDKDHHGPLEFDPLLKPTMFWQHCQDNHSELLRPDIDSWLKAEGFKPSASESFASSDLPTVFARFVSWKKSETHYVCGLCELEGSLTNRAVRPMLDYDPSSSSSGTMAFWTHCHEKHAPFYKPSSS